MFFPDVLEYIAYFFWTLGELDSDLVTGGCWSSWGISVCSLWDLTFWFELPGSAVPSSYYEET